MTVLVEDGRGGTDIQTYTINVVDSQEVGEIRGRVWEDVNSDGIQNAEEAGLAGFEVYLDLNRNSTLDADEPRTRTAADDPSTVDVDETGNYKFSAGGCSF